MISKKRIQELIAEKRRELVRTPPTSEKHFIISEQIAKLEDKLISPQKAIVDHKQIDLFADALVMNGLVYVFKYYLFLKGQRDESAKKQILSQTPTMKTIFQLTDEEQDEGKSSVEWIYSTDKQTLLSFENLCGILNYNVEKMRETIILMEKMSLVELYSAYCRFTSPPKVKTAPKEELEYA